MAGEKKLVRSKSGLRIVSSNENGRSPFELPEPPWISDRECLQCTNCSVKFDFMKRRHHCRRCGRIFCNRCCYTKLALPRMCFLDHVRICEHCTDVTRKENEFYEKHLKTLMSGSSFTISCMFTEAENASFFCKLSSDHRFIVFDGGNFAKHEPLDMCGIQSVQIVKTDSDFGGTTCATELKVVYDDQDEVKQVLHFKAASVPNKKQSVAWIVAMQKAVKMMYEAQSTPST